MTDRLEWGHRYLMCPPQHFGILYEINPWMHRAVQADPARSREQWEGVVEALEGAGAHVELLEPTSELPDMVFTANAGVVWGDHFVPSRFRHPQRSGEEPHYIRRFSESGAKIVELPAGPRFEGAGDALPFRDRIVAGYRIRSDYDAHSHLSEALGVEVLSVELTDPRFYHLDLTFCPLDDRRALLVPEAWDEYGRQVVRNLVPEPIHLTPDEALAFTANSVVIGDVVVMPSCSDRVRHLLEEAGFQTVVRDVSEFLKAGGGIRCLTLALDVGGDT